MRFKFALVGNPNCGKSTLFNALTHGNAAVGNWGGVTAAAQSGFCDRLGWEAELVDLPGLYSLTTVSPEQQTLLTFLEQERPDLLINVIDSTNLQRSLYLTSQLTETGLPLLLALNFSDELQRRGQPLDAASLSQLLALPCQSISAGKEQGLEPLLEQACQVSTQPYLGQSRAWAGLSPAARYERITALCAQLPVSTAQWEGRSQRIDRLLCHPVGAWLFLAVALGLLFFFSFGPVGHILTGCLETVLQWLRGATGSLLGLWGASPAWQSLLLDGVLSGIGGVLVFLPQLLLLFLGLGLLEASGYLARVAFVCDRGLAGLGLSGHSAIPLLLGLGCTVPAVLCCRNLPSTRQQRLTMTCLPLMSCSARLPAYILLADLVLPGKGWLAVAALYALGAVAAAATAWLGSRLHPREDAPFLLELPPYRRPVWRQLFLVAAARGWDFVSRAGGIIFLAALVVWAGSHFTPTWQYTADLSVSLLACAGQRLAPLLAPLGCGFWPLAVALLAGLLAKEAIVATLQVLYQGAAAAALVPLLHPAAVWALLVLILLYSPCTATLATLGRESGSLWFAFALALRQTAMAWLAAWLAYRIALLLF